MLHPDLDHTVCEKQRSRNHLGMAASVNFICHCRCYMKVTGHLVDEDRLN